jgi:O-antigen/teichoic acid export membrane protein
MTYPYVSRVLGLSNIGIVNFVDGLINYFILFAMMGIGTVGIREVAINKGDQTKLSKAFSGVLSLNIISTLVATAILLIAMYTLPTLFP